MKFIGEKVDNDNDSLGDHNALIMRPMNEFFGWLNNCGQARPIGNKMDHRHSSEPGSGLWCQGWTRSSGNTECLTHITYLESSQPFSYWYFVIICNKREMRANDPCSGAVIHHTSHKSRGNIKLGGARVFINISITQTLASFIVIHVLKFIGRKLQSQSEKTLQRLVRDQS